MKQHRINKPPHTTQHHATPHHTMPHHTTPHHIILSYGGGGSSFPRGGRGRGLSEDGAGYTPAEPAEDGPEGEDGFTEDEEEDTDL